MKRKSRHPSLRKRVIIIILIMVLLTSVFLIYFSLKGFEKERQWQNQIVEKNLEICYHLRKKQIETSIIDHDQGIFNTNPSTDPHYLYECIGGLNQYPASMTSSMMFSIFIFKTGFSILFHFRKV